MVVIIVRNTRFLQDLSDFMLLGLKANFFIHLIVSVTFNHKLSVFKFANVRPLWQDSADFVTNAVFSRVV